MKRIFSVTFLYILFFNFSSFITAQEVCQEKNVRFAVWASTECYPGVDVPNPDESVLALPVRKIKETVPFLLDGMLYGWNFDYTPYDKARKVPEFFEFSPVKEITPEDKEKIHYASPWIKDQRLNAWIEYERTESQVKEYNGWLSVKNPNIRGVGYAPLEDGFEGIQKACEEALKQAVREYERKKVKNKPKEITGKALIRKPPLIGVNAGRYMVTLDFFMESDKIIEYKTF